MLVLERAALQAARGCYEESLHDVALVERHVAAVGYRSLLVLDRLSSQRPGQRRWRRAQRRRRAIGADVLPGGPCERLDRSGVCRTHRRRCSAFARRRTALTPRNDLPV